MDSAPTNTNNYLISLIFNIFSDLKIALVTHQAVDVVLLSQSWLSVQHFVPKGISAEFDLQFQVLLREFVAIHANVVDGI